MGAMAITHTQGSQPLLTDKRTGWSEISAEPASYKQSAAPWPCG